MEQQSSISSRRIIHIDMDAFYAAIEQRDFPKYKNKPIIVGGDPGQRGVVATCSYEARTFGIHSAMPCAQAKKLCPHAIFVRPRFEVYREVSSQIRNLFGRYTDIIEPLSLDEAYLDVTGSDPKYGSATLIAKSLKQDIQQRVQLTASAGVSYNKFLAKLASDMQKPNGLTLITEQQGPEFVKTLAIGKFYGIGPATEARMHALNIYSGADLLAWSVPELQAVFGKVAPYYYYAARGLDHRPVVAMRERKSLGSETTFATDLTNTEEMLAQLTKLAQEVAADLELKQLCARTVTVKVKFDNFELITRSQTLERPTHNAQALFSCVPQLLQKAHVQNRRVRLLGVSVSNLMTVNALRTAEQQLNLL